MKPIGEVGVCNLFRHRHFLVAVVDPSTTETECERYSAVVVEKPDCFRELSFPWLTPAGTGESGPVKAFERMKDRINRDTGVYVHLVEEHLENVDSKQSEMF